MPPDGGARTKKEPRRKAAPCTTPARDSPVHRLLRQQVRRRLLVVRRGLLRHLGRTLLLERRVDRRLVGAAVLEQHLTLRRVLLAQAGARAGNRASRVVRRSRAVPDRPAVVHVPVTAVMVVMAVVVMVAVVMMAMMVVTMMVAAVMAAVMTTLGAGQRRVQQCKAERSGRSDGQKGGFTKHGSLLCDPWTASWRIVDCLSANRSMQLRQRFRPGMPKSGLNR